MFHIHKIHNNFFFFIHHINTDCKTVKSAITDPIIAAILILEIIKLVSQNKPTP